jgi:protein gp37
MADGSPIEWLARPGTRPATWNPIRARNTQTGRTGWHCVHVNEACRFCYAETMNRNRRNLPFGGTGLPFKPGHLASGAIEIFLDEKVLMQPLHWRASRTVFPCSMTDLHGEWVPDEWLDRIYAVMAATPHHSYLVLTKRARRRRDYLRGVGLPTVAHRSIAIIAQMEAITGHRERAGFEPFKNFALPNVWHGASAGNQPEADALIPEVLATPAAIRFMSLEPLLGPIDLTRIDDGEAHREVPRDEWGPVDDDDSPPALWWNALTGERTIMHGGASGEWSRTDASLDWIIAGGESGSEARPMQVEWADSIVAQCKAAGVACFVKQLGSCPTSDGYPLHLKSSKGGAADEWPDRLRVRQWPTFPSPRPKSAVADFGSQDNGGEGGATSRAERALVAPGEGEWP